MRIKNLLSGAINILFPRVCLICQKEEDYLCQDCQGLLEISGFHQKHSGSNFEDLYFALSYKNHLAQKLIRAFKYEPFVKELAHPLSFLIISHFQLMDKKPDFYPLSNNLPGKKAADFIIIPVPLHKKRLKWRGFNQAEKLGKELSEFFKIPLVLNCLIKTKETSPQIELSGWKRRENAKQAFAVKEKFLIKNKNILLVDDVYTTGATMQECARVLKTSGAKKIIGLVIARG